MNVAVIIPLGGGGERDRIATAVVAHLQPLGYPIDVIRGHPQAVASNIGARRTSASVLLLNDADTLVPHDQIAEAIRLATEAPGLVFAFDIYHRLDITTTGRVLAGTLDPFQAPVYQTFCEPPSHGCIAIRRECFDTIGGYDERLEMYADCAFNRTAARHWPLRRVNGEAIHLHHARLGDPGVPAWDERYASSRAIYDREYANV